MNLQEEQNLGQRGLVRDLLTAFKDTFLQVLMVSTVVVNL